MEGKDEEKEGEDRVLDVGTGADAQGRTQRESKCDDDGDTAAPSTSTALSLRGANAPPLSAKDKKYQEGIDLVQAFVQFASKVVNVDMAPFFDRVYEEFEQDWKDLANGQGETLQQYEVFKQYEKLLDEHLTKFARARGYVSVTLTLSIIQCLSSILYTSGCLVPLYCLFERTPSLPPLLLKYILTSLPLSLSLSLPVCIMYPVSVFVSVLIPYPVCVCFHQVRGRTGML